MTVRTHPPFFRATSFVLFGLFSLIAATAFAEGFTIHGTVTLGDAGTPAPGCTVWLVQERVTRKTETDAKGSYVFRKVAAGTMELVARKKDAVLGGFTGFAAGDAEIPLHVGPDATQLDVRIVDGQLAPVPGAKVRAMLMNDAFVVSVEDLVEEGYPALRSNDDGVIAIPNLPRDGFVKLIVAHYKFADSFISYLPVNGKRQDIILAEGVRVQGRVLDPEARGLAGARVSIFQRGTGGTREVAEVRTDPEGFFSARVEAGEYGVAASHSDFASPEPAGLVVNRGEEPPATQVAMLAPRHLVGRVLAPDRKALGGVRVVYRSGGTIFGDTLTDSEGRFRLRVAQATGTLNIVPPPGFMLPGLRDIPVNLLDASQADVGDIELKALPEILGQVLDAEGKPAANALVSVPDLPLPVWVITGEDGRFAIRLREEPEADVITVRADHATRFARDEEKVALRDSKPVTLRLATYSPALAPPARKPNTNDLSSLVGKPAPELESKTWVNSEGIQLASLKDKVVVLFFWAGFLDTVEFYNTMEEIRALHALLKGVDDVRFISIHDALSEPDEIEDYVKQGGVAFPVGRDADPFMTFDRYGIKFLPQVVLIDRAGVVRYDQTEGRLLDLIKDLRRR
jgi:hypothetical protein